MRSIEYKTIERWPRGHHNPHRNIVVRHRGRVWELESDHGRGDDVDVFMDGDRAYVLATRSGLGYVGLREYILDEKYEEKREDYDSAYISLGPSAEAFIDRDYDIAEILGRRGFDLKPITILKKVLPYLGDG